MRPFSPSRARDSDIEAFTGYQDGIHENRVRVREESGGEDEDRRRADLDDVLRRQEKWLRREETAERGGSERDAVASRGVHRRRSSAGRHVGPGGRRAFVHEGGFRAGNRVERLRNILHDDAGGT